MNRASKQHHDAMDLCDQALSARRNGDAPEAKRLFHLAFEKERSAAVMVDSEPTRSVLHRSAAALALDCGEHRAAEKLIASALAGEPPGEIAEELRDLLEKVHFRRHLELRGLELADDEMQFSISGKATSFGMAQSDQFLDRVRCMERLLVRTVERNRHMKFRETGRAIKEVSKNFELYLSVPRAASFAVTLKIGLPNKQMHLPTLEQEIVDQPNVVIDDLLNCLDAFNQGDQERLKKLIPDSAYRRNFAALADQMAPDGEQVKVVGLTVSRNGEERQVALNRDREKKPRNRQPGQETKEFIGVLRLADARREKRDRITIVDDEGKSHDFTVPSGLMADIVKPHWGERVHVTAHRRRNKYMLEKIEEVTEPYTNGAVANRGLETN